MTKYAIVFKETSQLVTKRGTGLFLIFNSQMNAYEYIINDLSRKERDDIEVIPVDINHPSKG